MIQDRIGTVLIVLASAWMASLTFIEPGKYAFRADRENFVLVAIGLMAVAFFPRHLNLTGTVFAFAMLGLSANIGFFGLYGMTWQGMVPTIVLVPALWLRRSRLDSDAIVVVSSAAALIIAVVQPTVIKFAISVIVIINLGIWLWNRVESLRARV